MEDNSLKNLWEELGSQARESKILNLQSWALNMQCFEEIQKRKAKRKIFMLLPEITLGIILGTAWVLFLAVLVFGSWFVNPFFTISIGIILVFNVIAVINYIRHLFLVVGINYENSIVETQEQLSKLQSALIKDNRFLLLQFPFYSTWFISMQWIRESPSTFWLIAVPIILALTAVGIFLYINASEKNLHKPWVKKMLSASGLDSVNKAMSFLEEIEDYRKEVKI